VKESNNDPPREIYPVAESVGKFIEYWGFKEIEGKIWTHIFLADQPMCAQELMERTGVSKGLMSISLARLLEFDVIRVEYTRLKRTQYFQVNEDVTEVIKGVFRQRERVLLADVRKNINLLSDLSKNDLQGVNQARVKFLKKMVTIGQNILDTVIFKDKKIISFFFGLAPEIKENKVKNKPVSL